VTRSDLAVGEILDDAGDLVAAVMVPWAAVLWLSAIPLRLAQAHFAARVAGLGEEAHEYGDHLQVLAVGVGVAFLVSLFGRAVFVRACVLRLRTLESSGAAPFRLRPGPFAAYVYAALAIEAAFYATCASVVAVPVFILVAGLAAATLPLLEGPGLLRPFGLIGASARRMGPLAGLLAVFGAAWLLAMANLFVAFQAGLWLADGVVGLDLPRWQGLLGPSNLRFVFVLATGAWLLVEPWWLATLVIYVHRLRSRASGEDLKLWFNRLRSVES
jgi:hypothetical protein